VGARKNRTIRIVGVTIVRMVQLLAQEVHIIVGVVTIVPQIIVLAQLLVKLINLRLRCK